MAKDILITGSTDGIGKGTAVKLAGQGHRVYLHGRDPERLAAAVSQVKYASGSDTVTGFTADFADLDAVGRMADEVRDVLTGLDVLINNAGVFKSPGEDGMPDLRFRVNYLAPVLLTQRLIPLLEKGTAPRIINLSSAAQSPVSLAALQGKDTLPQAEAYAQSKLALTMWSFHLAKTQSAMGVIAVNPGSLLHTKMATEAYGRFWSPADKGIDILCELAVSPDHTGVTGQYYDNDQGGFAQAHPAAYNPAEVDRLIRTTRQMI